MNDPNNIADLILANYHQLIIIKAMLLGSTLCLIYHHITRK